MKIGSVKFFKLLIVAVYLLLILVPLALAITFGILYAKQKTLVGTLDVQNLALAGEQTSANGIAEGPEPPVLFEAEDVMPMAPSFPYQRLYPGLYAEKPKVQTAELQMCYLTFDDGPSPATLKILDTLEKYNIKATFFVTGKASEENEDVLKRIAAAGHTVGIHSYSHKYDEIYASVEAYLADFYQMYEAIKECTGVAPTIFRFPGGSINSYNSDVYTQIIAEMTRRGFTFYDWNAAASDAVNTALTSQQITENIMHSAGDQERLIVLMHDKGPNSSVTTAALPDIIEKLQDRGFQFAALTSEVRPICYTYPMV